MKNEEFKMRRILFLCLIIFTGVAIADNDNDTLQIFNPDRVIVSNPDYVNAYLDRTHHHEEGVNDFYAEISGGLDMDQFKRKLYVGNTVSSTDYNATSIYGTLGLGYGRKIGESFYLGGLIDGSASAAESENEVMLAKSSHYFDLKQTFSGGIYVLPGWFIVKNILLYGKIGAVGSQFRVETDAPTIFNDDSFDKIIFGLGLGAGVRVYFNTNYSVSAEYNFSDYSSVDHYYDGVKNTYSPKDNRINLSFAYHFIY